MKRYTHCSFCKNEIIIASTAQNRPDLQMEKGTEFIVNCMSCGKNDKKHVNDVRAESSKKIMIIGVVLGLVIAVFLFFLWGGVGVFGFIIPLLFRKEEMSAVSAFNSYLVRRK